MKNQVIKNLNPEMGKEIIKYFQSLGVDTKTYTGEISKQDDWLCIYYGVIDGYFGNYSYNTVQVKNAEIIELPSLPKRGDKVLVWDGEGQSPIEALFITYIEGAHYPIVVAASSDIDLYLKGEPFGISTWRYWKPKPKEKIVELTLEDISNGKGVGVKPELIRIK